MPRRGDSLTTLLRDVSRGMASPLSIPASVTITCHGFSEYVITNPFPFLSCLQYSFQEREEQKYRARGEIERCGTVGFRIRSGYLGLAGSCVRMCVCVCVCAALDLPTFERQSWSGLGMPELTKLRAVSFCAR